nr:MAG: hypothetical protein J07AB56_06170 [Candidatus Nanosalinarum sp. J07AB56]
MMLPTHAATGLLLGVAASQLFSYGSVTVFLAVAGSVVPDLDMLMSHKRTLHYPIVGLLSAVALWLLSPHAGMFAFSAGVHAVMDVFSNGKTMRPGTDSDPRAVYDHASAGWLSPVHLCPTGSIRDLALCTSIAVSVSLVQPDAWFLSVFVVVSALSGRYIMGVVQREDPEYDRLSEYLKDRLP